MRIGSLCSGFGGLDLAVMAVLGGTPVWHAEIDPAARKVLEAHWPQVPNLGDATAIDWTTVESVDILTAGYPCQPFSLAGKRGGENDPRHLWPFVFQGVRTLRPELVLLENVPGHRSKGFGRVLADLASIGYVGSWRSVRASDIGAPHRRERVFILAWPADAPGVGHGYLRAQSLTGIPAAAVASDLIPTPGARLGQRHSSLTYATAVRRRSMRGNGPNLDEWAALLPTPRATDGTHGGPNQRGRRGDVALPAAVQPERWGVYAPAVSHWESIRGCPAPDPTMTATPGRTGVRLAAPFVEWMMGLPAGHVTDHVKRNDALRLLGNGVVPRQGALALSLLLDDMERVTLPHTLTRQRRTPDMLRFALKADRDELAAEIHLRNQRLANTLQVLQDPDRTLENIAADVLAELRSIWGEEALWWDGSTRKNRKSAAILRREAMALLSEIITSLRIQSSVAGQKATQVIIDDPIVEQFEPLATPLPVSDICGRQEMITGVECTEAPHLLGKHRNAERNMEWEMTEADLEWAQMVAQRVAHNASLTVEQKLDALMPAVTFDLSDKGLVRATPAIPDATCVIAAGPLTDADLKAVEEFRQVLAAPAAAAVQYGVEKGIDWANSIISPSTPLPSPAEIAQMMTGPHRLHPTLTEIDMTMTSPPPVRTLSDDAQVMSISLVADPPHPSWAVQVVDKPQSEQLQIFPFSAPLPVTERPTTAVQPYLLDVGAGTPKLDHLSYSQLETFQACGLKYRLKYVDGLRGQPWPAWWNVGGTTFHEAVREIEQTHLALDDHAAVKALWQRHWELTRLSTFRESGVEEARWSAANKGTEDAAWWGLEGPEMIHRYLGWRSGMASEGWDVLRVPPAFVGGEQRLAVELKFELPVLGWPIVGFIDRVDARLTHIGGDRDVVAEALVYDYKTGGRLPDDTLQLGVYAHAIQKLLPPVQEGWALMGNFYHARKGAFALEQSANLLDRHPIEELEYHVETLLRARDAGVYAPRVTSLCKSCEVRHSCPIMATRVQREEASA